MNLQETLALLRELRLSGATHFRSQDFEVSLQGGLSALIPEPLIIEGKTPESSGSPKNEEATEKLKDLIETLKMDDQSILDKIFPNGAGG